MLCATHLAWWRSRHPTIANVLGDDGLPGGFELTQLYAHRSRMSRAALRQAGRSFGRKLINRATGFGQKSSGLGRYVRPGVVLGQSGAMQPFVS